MERTQWTDNRFFILINYYFLLLNVKIFWENNGFVNLTIAYCYLGLADIFPLWAFIMF